MNKEPIIIDDVDVSECEEHYLNKYNDHMCCDYKTSDCSPCKPKQKQCYFYVESIENKLKRKEQECEEWKNKLAKSFADERKKEIIIDLLKAENEKMSKGYEELTEIVSPYIDDFTGYNEELQGFDIVLCVKELMQQLDALETENEKLRQYKASKQASYETMQKEWNDAKNEVKKLKKELDDFQFEYDSLSK